MMQTDVLSANLVATGAASTQRNRIRAVLITPGATAGTVVITDGPTGAVKLNFISGVTPESSFYALLPGEGILCTTGIYVTITNAAAVTIFYS